MRRDGFVKSIGGFFVVLAMVFAVSAQQPVYAQGGGTAGASNPGLSMFLDVDWTQPASQDGQTKVVQENIGDGNLDLMQYGLHESCLLTSGVPGSATRPFSVWSGEFILVSGRNLGAPKARNFNAVDADAGDVSPVPGPRHFDDKSSLTIDVASLVELKC